MKVSQLIKFLQEENPDREVILASDPEGNSFHLFSGVIERCAYRKDDFGDVEIGLERLTPKLKKQGYTEEDLVEGGRPALVIFP